MILCGLFCSGKSTIGNALAKRLDLPFYETDLLLGGRHLWDELGEEAFRSLETAAILSLKKQSCVIATGGGALLREENRLHLKKIGKSVYLKTSISIIWDRIQKRGFPAFLDRKYPKEHLEQLAVERLYIYETFCEYTFETEGLSFEQCVTHLANFFASPLGGSLMEKPLGLSSMGVQLD